MTAQEAIAYIHSLHGNKSHADLEYFRRLLEKLGNPQNNCKFIHVAGTNGKGSVCAATDSILRAAGYKTGLYTSPFIVNFRERIRIGGEMIAEEELASLTEQVKEVTDSMEDVPGEFEFITAIGFLAFARAELDIVVCEVGLGGRLDPTNVIEHPVLSIVTGIDFDHMNLLGNTIQKIAAEKAGIFKTNCPALYGGIDSSACRVLTTAAAYKKVPFYTVDRSRTKVQSMTLDGTVFSFGDLKDLKTSLLGIYQPKNLTTVLTAMEILTEAGWKIPESAIREGLQNVRWQARFEILSRENPLIIFDGSHNPQGAISAVQSIGNYFPEQTVNILSAVMADKDFDGMIEVLKPVTNKAFAVSVKNPRALSAEEYANHMNLHHVPAVAFDSVEEGLRAAVKASKEEGIPLFCLGSLYLYGELIQALSKI